MNIRQSAGPRIHLGRIRGTAMSMNMWIRWSTLEQVASANFRSSNNDLVQVLDIRTHIVHHSSLISYVQLKNKALDAEHICTYNYPRSSTYHGPLHPDIQSTSRTHICKSFGSSIREVSKGTFVGKHTSLLRRPNSCHHHSRLWREIGIRMHRQSLQKKEVDLLRQ